MKEFFLLVKERLLKREPLVLVTITGSSGSSPRGAGARMLVGKGSGGGALLWGSIGGGLPEHLAIEEAAQLFETRGSVFRKYELHPADTAALDPVCGGEVSVFSRLLDAGEKGLLELTEKALSCFSGGKAAWLVMEVSGPASGAAGTAAAASRPSADYSLGVAAEDGFLFFTGTMPKDLKPLLRPGLVCLEEEGKYWLCEPFISGGFVYIFGGGHIARELVPLLARLDFRCVVFDDREEFSDPALFPGAEKVIRGDFEHIENFVNLAARDYAVIVTRGHLWDLEAWAFALESPAAYIGVIGSKTKHEFVKKRLRERGFGSEAINAPRVHAPIGVKIKSETIAEIAVSIAGELILTRRSHQYDE